MKPGDLIRQKSDPRPAIFPRLLVDVNNELRSLAGRSILVQNMTVGIAVVVIGRDSDPAVYGVYADAIGWSFARHIEVIHGSG